jgi:ribosomal protein S18 acetylase RimI-like enzyme
VIEVRRVRADDWQALRETRLRALADAPDAFVTTYDEASVRPEQWWRDWTAGSANGDAQAMFLAWTDGRPLGIAGVFLDDGRYMVISMWTDPLERGRGVARALLDEAVGFAGDAEIVLSVTEGNDEARRLYEHFGFVDTGRTEPLRPGSELIIREMRLAR